MSIYIIEMIGNDFRFWSSYSHDTIDIYVFDDISCESFIFVFKRNIIASMIWLDFYK